MVSVQPTSLASQSIILVYLYALIAARVLVYSVTTTHHADSCQPFTRLSINTRFHCTDLLRMQCCCQGTERSGKHENQYWSQQCWAEAYVASKSNRSYTRNNYHVSYTYCRHTSKLCVHLTNLTVLLPLHRVWLKLHLCVKEAQSITHKTPCCCIYYWLPCSQSCIKFGQRQQLYDTTQEVYKVESGL